MTIATIASSYMPCPLFIPIKPIARFAFEAAPLGEVYGGFCASDSALSISNETLHECCNRGYARRCCNRAAQAESDAIRFLIKSHREGLIEVAWSAERNHHPIAVGTIEIQNEATAFEAWSPARVDDPLTLQARAYAAGYLRSRGLNR